jgi:WD40 repeat protein
MFDYDAFISYSRSDTAAAVALQRALQRFATPWYARRGLRVFRDESHLAPASSLRAAIKDALQRSRVLVILATPNAARSRWVAHEVEEWLSGRGVDSILIVKQDGAIGSRGQPAAADQQALPLALQDALPDQPLYVDITGLTPSLATPAYRQAIARAAAVIHGRPLDDLIGDDLRQHRNKQRALVATGSLMVGLASAATYAWSLSVREETAKEAERAAKITERLEKTVRAKEAMSRELAARSAQALARRDHASALLLGVAAQQAKPTIEADGAILAALAQTSRLLVELEVTSQVPISTAALGGANARWLVLGHGDDLSVWDWARRERVATRRGAHPGYVSAVEISPQGGVLASAGSESGFALWRLPDLQLLQEQRDTSAFTVKFSPDGEHLLVGGSQGQMTGVVDVWNISTLRRLHHKTVEQAGTITSFSIDPSSERVAAGSLLGVVRVWTWPDLRRVQDVAPEPSTGTFVAFSAHENRLLVGGAGGGIDWDLGLKERYGDPFATETEAINGIGYLADGDPAMVVGPEVLKWNIGELRTIASHPTTIHSLAVDAGGELFATGSVSGHARVWEALPRNAFVHAVEVCGELAPRLVAFSPDAALLAIGCDNTRFVTFGRRETTQTAVHVFDVATRKRLWMHEGHPAMLHAMAAGPHGVFATVDDDGVLQLWRARERDVRTIATSADGNAAIAVAFAPRGTHVAWATNGGPARIANVADSAVVWTSESPDVQTVAFDRESGDLAYATADGELWIRRGERRPEVVARLPTKSRISQLGFLETGRRVFVSQDRALLAVDLDTGHIVKSSFQDIASATVSGSRGAALTRSGRLDIWDPATLRLITTLEQGRHGSFSPMIMTTDATRDGRLVAAVIDGQVWVYDLSPESVRARACHLAASAAGDANVWAQLTSGLDAAPPCTFGPPPPG